MKDSNKKITEDPPKKIDWEMVEKDLIEKQDLWWLNESKVVGKKKTQLEVALETGRSFKKEELFASKNWLSPENYQTYIRRVFEILQKHKNEHGFLDRETDEAFEAVKEEYELINENSVNLDGRRKPHTAFIANRVKLGKERGESWEKFKQLANDSVGKNQVELPGYRKIYLRRVRKNPEKEILYSHEPFDHDKAENLPDGVVLIKRTAFDKAWTQITNKPNMNQT